MKKIIETKNTLSDYYTVMARIDVINQKGVFGVLDLFSQHELLKLQKAKKLLEAKMLIKSIEIPIIKPRPNTLISELPKD